MNNAQLLEKIHELGPETQVTFTPDIPQDVVRMFLVFVARAQHSMAQMYTGFHIKSCKYMGRPFYRLSLVFRSSREFLNAHHYPNMNVDVNTLDMYHAAGKVPRCNLERADYVVVGYAWHERGSHLLSVRGVEEANEFVRRHNLN